MFIIGALRRCDHGRGLGRSRLSGNARQAVRTFEELRLIFRFKGVSAAEAEAAFPRYADALNQHTTKRRD